MKIDTLIIKIGGIVLAQQLLAIFKQSYKRWVIKTHITTGELSIFKMFTKEFITTLTPAQMFWIGGIALFTIATFPIGMWLGSFDMGASYPIMNMIGGLINLITFPVTLYVMNAKLHELEFTANTKIGIFIVVISKVLVIIGCWFMYQGNNGASSY